MSGENNNNVTLNAAGSSSSIIVGDTTKSSANDSNNNKNEKQARKKQNRQSLKQPFNKGELQGPSSSLLSSKNNKVSKDDSENKSEALESLQQIIASLKSLPASSADSVGRKSNAFPNINKQHKKGASVSFYFPSPPANTSSSPLKSVQDPDDSNNKPMNIENALQDTLTSLRRMSQDRVILYGGVDRRPSYADQDDSSPTSPFDFKKLNDDALANATTNSPPIFPVKSIVQAHGRRHSVALNNNKDIMKELEKNQTRTIDTDGKGHRRTNSRNLDNNWRSAQPFNQFQVFNKFGGGQNQKKQQQNQQNSNQQQRKSLFAPYLPQASLPSHLKAGELVYGVLRINKRNRSDAYVTTEFLDSDIYICGSKDRNRALEGDIVAIQLLDPEKKVDKKKDDVEVEGQGLLLFEDDEVITDDQRPKYCGHVVAVMERMPGQMFSGTLALLRPSSSATKEREAAEKARRDAQDRANGIEPRIEESRDYRRDERTERPKIVWFKPTDKRVPLIAIPTEQAPLDFVENHQNYAQKLFVACIKRWPITSLHPFGTLVSQLGEIGDIDVETQALIRDNNISTEEFNENVLKCLPQVPWTIPEKEIELRRDLRSTRIFTIDPSTANDLDDAISCARLPDGNYEIGVHIADVSYFVKPNTLLDREARKRATTVYLVQKGIPMLPNLLSEDLCSLTPGADRLAFSVFWTMTPEGRYSNTRFGKTIIKPCAKLSYDDAQEVIDGRPLNPNVKIYNDFSASEIEADIKVFHELSQKMREIRYKRGALSLSSIKLTFDIDENDNPIQCHVYKQNAANQLIEEFMLLANMSAAHKISSTFPEQALLRRHAAPIDRRLNDFREHAARFGYEFDISSAGALQRSFNKVDNADAKEVLELLAIKPLQRAKYFCTGTLDIAKYQHYALNVPLYTHFTSPIRRYADVLVHRMLEAALSGERKFYIDKDNVQKTASYCNIKKEAANNAQEQSNHLFLCVLLNNLAAQSGPVIREAKVVGVKEHAFDVLIPIFGIEKRVHLDQLPLEKFIFNSEKMELTLVWKHGVSSLEPMSDDYGFEATSTIVNNNDTGKGENVLTTTAATAVAPSSTTSFNEKSNIKMEENTSVNFNIAASSPEEVSSSTSTANKLSSPTIISSAPVIQQPVVSKLTITSDPAIPNSQIIRELTHLNVVITADCKKSPPVIKVLAVNPFT
ncbi:3396_t:CDS:10 [Entrophospora sp. SA101]|nr:3396_t:CDS:10 [Entrophospora sp. SA101]